MAMVNEERDDRGARGEWDCGRETREGHRARMQAQTSLEAQTEKKNKKKYNRLSMFLNQDIKIYSKSINKFLNEKNFFGKENRNY